MHVLRGGDMQVLVIDDHPVVIAGCRAMLSPYHDIEVIDALDAETAYERYVGSRPDVVVVDLNLSGISGFALTRRILRFDPGAHILVLTMNDDPIFAARAIECGAKGYIGKCEDPANFVAAIRTVAAGESFILPEMAQKLVFLDPGRRGDFPNGLNARELEILHLLRKGKNMTEIAAIIKMSYKTVANARTVLKRKLGANSASDLLRIAVERKLA
jgi:two-component system invasion response regulator UvrY